ncbi:EMC1 ER membrane protein complex subunit 1 [Candida maltosa Xu316]|uniref:ER membrane protein complex subunit 1 n=1 Tax=Candida maltosa (strain Xu316) TaxID=1245528 RepID=M3HGL5_CANMX|nr:hypothetical protein G210_3344 [Candida maltosa Xu316]
MFTSVWLIISSLLYLANAVLVDDAFSSRESINYLYGTPLQNLSLLKNNILIGTNANNQLLGIDVLNQNSIVWKIDLNKKELLTTQDKVYSYSNSDDEIYSIDSTGALDIIELGSSLPKKIIDATFGVFIIDSENTLKYYNDGGNVVSIQSDTSFVRVDNNHGYIYVIINDKKLLKLSKTGKVLYTVDLAVGSIKEFKSGIILTENDQIFKFDEHGKSFKRVENDSFKNLAVIDANVLYSTLPESIQLISIKDNSVSLTDTLKIKPNSSIELFSTPLNKFLIISHQNTKQVYDLTDFIETKDSKSIKSFVYKLNGDFPFNFVSVDGNQLNLISIDDSLNGDIFSLFDGSHIATVEPQYHQYYSKSGKYLIIDEPESEILKHELQSILQEGESKFILSNWLHRVTRHLSELGKFVTSFDYKNLFSSEDAIKFVKLIVFYDEDHEKIVAVRSNDFGLAWELPFKDDLITLKQTGDETVTFLFKSKIIDIDTSSGKIVSERPNDGHVDVIQVKDALAFENNNGFVLTDKVDTNTFYRKVIGDNELVGYFIPSGLTQSKKTWNFKFDDPIVALKNAPFDSVTSSLGTPLADKSVLYKYLNPNTISVLTYGDSFKFYLIDGITGNLLTTFTHDSNEKVDPESINLIMDDNWIIYSYFTTEPKLEQRINVIDLFDSKYTTPTDNKKSSTEIGKVSTKSFIYPERILKLKSTQSLHGITLKSIIALTESGNLIEIPKFILNSRRPEHEVKAEDYANDFRVVPYDPIVAKTNFQVLNHKYQLKNSGEILIKPTLFESTAVVCFFNSENQYCGLIQPSNSFDLLNKGFDRVKLSITIAILLVAYIVSKPYVFNKKLNAQWLDRK